MKVTWILTTVLACAICMGAENLFPNGDLKKNIPFIPLEKQVKAKGFQVTTPWAKGFLVDLGSTPGKITYQGGDEPRIIIQNTTGKETTIYTTQLFNPGSYKLRFTAKGLTPKSYLKIRIYRYTKEKKWLEGIVLNQFNLDGARPNMVLDFTENKPNEAFFAIAISCCGEVSFGNFQLLDTKK